MTQDDMAISESEKASQEAVSGVFGKMSMAAGVRNLYIILLGRKADGRARVSEFAVKTIEESLRYLMQLPEFEEALDTVSQTGTLPSREAVPERDLARASAWLAELLQTFESRTTPSWAGLLHDALGNDVIASLVPDEIDREQAIDALKSLVGTDSIYENEIAVALGFDAKSFADRVSDRLYSGWGEQIDPAMPVPKKGSLPAVLTLFTDSVDYLQGHDRPETFGALIRSTQSAARKGLLGHWLFDTEFYTQAVAQARDVEIEDDAAALPPYLQFLLVGDPADIAPHTLFSPYAYRQLNTDIEIGPDGCFHDYVSRSIDRELRTSALFDPEFYLARQPHVRQEIAVGRYASALEHFVRVGLLAGYAFSPDFDRDFYLKACPDVAQALEQGHLPSAEWHYIKSGVREGRPPNGIFNPEYYAQRYPFIGEEMRHHGINSTLEHFLLLGRARGWRANQPPVQRDVDIDQAKALFEKRGRRAYAEALAGIFAYDEPPAEPKLSVIVPISGQADFTAGFLKCARWAADHLEHKRGVTTEIIIVDNGSTDHTEQLLAALPGVNVVRFEQPIGFPAAVNAGADAARGDVLLITNNDIEFQADAFLRIIDGFNDYPQIGILGAKIILPNETLQEVGAILEKDAGVRGVGRGLDATECPGARMVDVDYASGCFIALARADFETVSGMNEAFSPGYYEEVDLSLRMWRELGKTTVVDTGLAVIHYEHASFSKGRPQTVNEPLALRNRALLKAAHADLFSGLRDQDPTQKIRQAQQALSGSARVLFVADMIPSGVLGSGFGREEDLLDILAESGIPFDIVALHPSEHIDDYKNPMVKVYRAWMPEQSLDEVLTLHVEKYSHLWLFRPHNLGVANPILCEAKVRQDLKVICDTEGLAATRLVEQLRIQGREPTPEDLLALVTAELQDPVGVDLWVAVNKHERDVMESLGIGPVHEIGHTVSLKSDAANPMPFQDRTRMLFIGAMDDIDSANYDGLIWFLTRVYPKLRPQGRPRLTVAGHWPRDLKDDFMRRFSRSEIDFLGSVTPEELTILYAESRLAIAPTRYESGVSRKVIEAMVGGVPVVMTDLLAEQLELDTDTEINVADRFDDGAEFATRVDRLWRDEAAWMKQVDLQRDAIGDTYSRTNFASQVHVAASAIGIVTV